MSTNLTPRRPPPQASPPPLPPQAQRTLTNDHMQSLCPELLLSVLDYLPLNDWISFAFAHYALLRQRNLVPALTPLQVAQLVVRHRRASSPASLSPSPSSGSEHGSVCSSSGDAAAATALHNAAATTVLQDEEVEETHGAATLASLPPELLLQAMRDMARDDVMAFVVANYHDLCAKGIVPRLLPGTVRQLWLAVDVDVGVE